MKKIAILAASLLWISIQGQAQTPSPNTHAPEQAAQSFPQGEPTAKEDSLKSKLVKGTQSSRNARRSGEATASKNTVVRKKTTKTVRTKKPVD
jgi:cytoskeletal protein RodZ